MIPLEEVSSWRESQQKAGKTVVATNGCFDILHVGHLRYLSEAAKLGDVLIIGVNSDASVSELKGPDRPVTPEEDRAELLCGLKCVTEAAIFHDVRATEFLMLTAPDIYVKGGDYKVSDLNADEVAAVQAAGGKIEILPLVPGKSTTAVLDRVHSTSP